LFPAVPALSRQTIAADEIGGYQIPGNSVVFPSPYGTQRLPALWEEPEQFDPDRFTPERSDARPRFAYFPFGGGPRLCIGNEFAMMEAQLIPAMVVQRYRLCPVPGHVVEPEVRVSRCARAAHRDDCAPGVKPVRKGGRSSFSHWSD
jgi:cytochrome P450